MCYSEIIGQSAGSAASSQAGNSASAGQAISAASSIAAGYQRGRSEIAAGKFNKKMYEYQASLNNSRAKRAEEAGGVAGNEAIDRMRRLIASGRTAYAANGLLLDGAPTDAPNLWEQDQAAMLAYEQAGIRDAASTEAWGFRNQAAMDIAQAKWAKMAGRNSANSLLYGAAASSISSLASSSK